MAGRLDTLTAPVALPAESFSAEESRILIVDDDPVVRESLGDVLDVLSYQVEAASGGREALAMIKPRRYDVVLTDLRMPNMSGFDLLREIKKIDPLLPVVVITGYATIKTAIEAMRHGASDFLAKPFDVSVIDHVLKKVLRERSLILKNQQMQAELNQKAVIEELNRQLNEKVDELTKLYAISELMNRLVDNDSLLKEIVEVAASITGAEKVSLMLLDRSRGELIIRAAVGMSRSLVRSVRLRLGEGVAGKVAVTKKPLRLDRLVSVEDTQARTDGRSYLHGSFLCAPILVGEELFGVLNLTDKHDGSQFTQKDEDLILNLAQKAAIKLENNALYEGLYSNLVDTLRALVITIEARDPYTHRHSQRVTDYAIVLGRLTGLSEEELEILSFVGILHDIGKIGIQDKILHKRGALTDEEWAHIKSHPAIGEMIVKPLGLVDTERALIRHHHERLDGKGYPDGLTDGQIIPVVRVLSVADSFDAMTSDRPYRQAMRPYDALAELHKCVGTQFDGKVVCALEKALDDELIRFAPRSLAAIPLAG